MTRKNDKDYNTLKKFIGVYCRKVHGTPGRELCARCSGLLEYARARLENCPYDPKPKCKDCETHCYKPEYRRMIREVMRFSGMHFVKRGRLDLLFRYFYSPVP
ncbi:MAG: nitrous oxide-stimulated promoter family protein [Gemmatimonadota bacterium]|nr:nitrous oxide-stimulated promoter family protein [Gemmatimonadota bacterium]